MRYFSVPCKVLTAAHRDLLLKFDYVGCGEKKMMDLLIVHINQLVLSRNATNLVFYGTRRTYLALR